MYRWSPEAKEIYALELEIQKRENVGHESACAVPVVADYRKQDRKHFINSTKQILVQLSTGAENLCNPKQFLSCQSGTCLCQDTTNTEWDPKLSQCVLIRNKCRGFNDSSKLSSRLLFFDQIKPETETWKIPQGSFCSVEDQFCGDLRKNGFFYKPAQYNTRRPIPPNPKEPILCLHCDLDNIQTRLLERFKLGLGQACKYEHQAALLQPTEYSKSFSRRMENLDLLATQNNTEFCKLDKFLSCTLEPQTRFTGIGTCKCFGGLIPDESGGCRMSPLFRTCGTTTLTTIPSSPFQIDMELPVEWRPLVDIPCESNKPTRCVPDDENEESRSPANVCTCAEGKLIQNFLFLLT